MGCLSWDSPSDLQWAELGGGGRGACHVAAERGTAECPTLSEEDSQSLEVIQARSQAAPRLWTVTPQPLPPPPASWALGTGHPGHRPGHPGREVLAGGGPWPLSTQDKNTRLINQTEASGARQAHGGAGAPGPGVTWRSSRLGAGGAQWHCQAQWGLPEPGCGGAGTVTPLPSTPVHMCSFLGA